MNAPSTASTTTSEERVLAAQHWLRSDCARTGVSLEALGGDASFRRYFRVRCPESQQTWILMDAPPDKEDCEPFLRIGRHWHQRGISVPAILEADLAQGFLLLEDFGDVTLHDTLPESRLSSANNATANKSLTGTAEILSHYEKALETLHHIQSIADTPSLPRYDAALLDREMMLFADWLCAQWVGNREIGPPPQWTELSTRLRKLALDQHPVAVHRDYHSRNLMVSSDGRLGVLDFQDAVIGPITYDLASLTRDCYARWPDEQMDGWIQGFHANMPGRLRRRLSLEQFQIQVDSMGAQRHLKAAGIFARLFIRDGKQRYLADIPNTLAYLPPALDRVGGFTDFSDWIRTQLVPAVQTRLLEHRETL